MGVVGVGAPDLRGSCAREITPGVYVDAGICVFSHCFSFDFFFLFLFFALVYLFTYVHVRRPETHTPPPPPLPLRAHYSMFKKKKRKLIGATACCDFPYLAARSSLTFFCRNGGFCCIGFN